MTVNELLECLSAMDGDLEVIVQKDSEGNGYSPLVGAEVAYYVADTTWSGTAYHHATDAAGQGDYAPCVVVWPVN